jgi:hypothetical protein
LLHGVLLRLPPRDAEPGSYAVVLDALSDEFASILSQDRIRIVVLIDQVSVINRSSLVESLDTAVIGVCVGQIVLLLISTNRPSMGVVPGNVPSEPMSRLD